MRVFDLFGQIPTTVLYVLFGGVVVSAIVLVLGVRANTGRLRYAPQTALFSPAERYFLEVLEASLGEDFRIYAKVRIADLLKPAERSGGKRWWRAFTKISSKHVDYVIVDRSQLQVLAAVELDDRSHERKERRLRDTFVNDAFAQAGIRLVRVPVRRNYNINKLRTQVLG